MNPNLSAVPVIYLAGGMRSGWQDKVMAAVPKGQAIFIDPRTQAPGASELEYTRFDLTGVDLADIVFGYMEKSNPGGSGLALEFGFASAHDNSKFLMLVEEDGYPQQKYFGMVRSVSDVVVSAPDGDTALMKGIGALLAQLAL